MKKIITFIRLLPFNPNLWDKAGKPRYSRNTKWGMLKPTGKYKWIKIKHLNNGHLANIIQYVSRYPDWYSNELFAVLLQEALNIRKLSIEYVNTHHSFNPEAPYKHYKNP